MEKQPKFIKEFSKQQSPEQRSLLAKEVVANRAEHRAAHEAADAHAEALREQLDSIRTLETKIEDLSENGVSRVKNYFKLRGLRAQLGGERSSYDAASKGEIVRPDMQETATMVADFYAHEKKKWEESPYTKEDVEKNFTEEHLAGLTSDEYITLLKRFPNEMVTHVTRQGVRDHYAMREHTAGLGEFHNGFVSTIEDGRLRSPLGIKLVADEKDAAIANYLHLETIATREDALRELGAYEEKEYTDAMAIHVATEEVADVYYGGEAGGEIFFAFPSVYIASQHHFLGQLERSTDTWHNDQYIYAQEERGVDINAGFTFIPEGARVDPETGSQYTLNEHKNPVVNERLFYALENLLESENFCSWVREENAQRAWDRGTDAEKDEIRSRFERRFLSYTDEMKSFIFTYNFLSQANRNFDELSTISQLRDKGEDTLWRRQQFRRSIHFDIEHNYLMPRQMLYKRAEHTVTSKEYWENYFAQHPDKKPSKIVYYIGSPTRALFEWRKENGLMNEAREEDFGFSERSVSRDSSQATAGMDRFKDIATDVINRYYDKKEVERE